MFERCRSLNRCSSIGVCTLAAIERSAAARVAKLPRASPGCTPCTARRSAAVSLLGSVSTCTCEPSESTWARISALLPSSTASAARLASASLVPARMLTELSITSTSSNLSARQQPAGRFKVRLAEGQHQQQQQRQRAAPAAANSASVAAAAELWVRRSKNITELKGRGSLFCRRSRCKYSGTPIDMAPSRYHGASKPIQSRPWRIDRYSRSAASSG